MEPDSRLLVVALLVLAMAAVVGVMKLRLLAVRLVSGLLAIVLSATAGIAIVNDYYAYYQTWSQLSADFGGSYSGFTSAPIAARTVPERGHGRVEVVTLAGARSGISRRGLVYLPPQYFQPAYAHTVFPVVELLRGTPGTPRNWVEQLHVAHVLDHLVATHRMGPVVAVMPTMSVGSHFEECVDAPGALDDTYVTQDVRTDVQARYRVSRDPAEWGVAGYSSGGYCAANLALRHRSLWGAAGIMDGYFRPGDGPAAAALHFDHAAEAANDPLLEARELASGVHPLPSFWVMAGTGDSGDYAGAKAFLRALHGVEAVPLHREPSATHNFTAWRSADPTMLSWMWTQLAPPDLRVQFPLTGSSTVRHVVPHRHAVTRDVAQPPG